MKISEDTLKIISQLSKLEIEDVMKDKMNEVDTSKIKPMSHPLNQAQNLREDIISENIERDKYIENAPHSDNGYYLSPKVIEQK